MTTACLFPPATSGGGQAGADSAREVNRGAGLDLDLGRSSFDPQFVAPQRPAGKEAVLESVPFDLCTYSSILLLRLAPVGRTGRDLRDVWNLGRDRLSLSFHTVLLE